MSETEIKTIHQRNKVLSILIPILYVPFALILALRFNITDMSLSRIGWIEGSLKSLIYYVFATALLLVYQAKLFTKISGKNSKLFRALTTVGAAMLVIGAAFPVTGDSPAYSHMLHSYLCQAGSVISITAIAVMVALYCKENRRHTKKAVLSYAAIVALVTAGFIVLHTAALFEIGAAFLLTAVMQVVNASAMRQKFSTQELAELPSEKLIEFVEIAEAQVYTAM